jgi:hypothetical protein
MDRAWKEHFKAQTAERDAVSKTKHAQILKNAKDALEKFYAEYNDKKNKQIARNKESEKGLRAKEESSSSSATVWVCFPSRPSLPQGDEEEEF